MAYFPKYPKRIVTALELAGIRACIDMTRLKPIYKPQHHAKTVQNLLDEISLLHDKLIDAGGKY